MSITARETQLKIQVWSGLQFDALKAPQRHQDKSDAQYSSGDQLRDKDRRQVHSLLYHQGNTERGLRLANHGPYLYQRLSVPR